MKHLIKILMLLVFLGSFALAQSSSDTSVDKKSKEVDETQNFIDKNANGVDDRMEKQRGEGKQKRMRDRFIDLDGDGICDGRSGGVGLRYRQGDKQNRQGGHKSSGDR
ncbi:MAG: hypothetical protein KKG06_03065 [Bacteroidetes bacterium]|nr:hypothetical protein [Bacteroidota bacterium]MBU1422158.1 hypothetical protein [Bacteroidota bacterium]